ncbi:hypothetical protein RUM44_007881 [Polyplax serrata]|uniref:PBZ-type domain-containing protein n=1 Tax=Polyplax serrata TaxID=468196 RepID=A0ABR1B8L2_POLSC
METKEKPVCSYGSKCYRKNPKHFEAYSHPNNIKADNVGGDSTKELHVAKRHKIEQVEDDTRRTSPRNRPYKMSQTTFTNRRKEPNIVESRNRKNSKGRQSTNNSLLQATIKPSKSNQEQVPHNRTTEKSDESKISENGDESDDAESVKSSSWIFIRKENNDTDENIKRVNQEGKSVEEIIKHLFLFDMPKCFYSFFDFCESINKDDPTKAIEFCGLKLVGPYDVLLGKINLSFDRTLALCHWRYYYDPPEFQTVLASNSSGFHVGYWRDDPKEQPVFLASNNAVNCTFKVEAENLFGTVFHYLDTLITTSDPFTKVKISKFQSLLTTWAKKHEFHLQKNTNKMDARQKRVVTKSFHKLGIVVPVEKKTELGYRPLLESEANLKKICKHIMQADGEAEREALWENLQPLINAANIANDECDFGNGLELGIDLFCMGSSVFHEIIEHLLTTAYSLLDRNEFEEIIKAHLKSRKNGCDLGVK